MSAEPRCAAAKLPSFLIIFHSDEEEVDERAFIIREPWTTTKQLQKL
jgi:hypothetical protein